MGLVFLSISGIFVDDDFIIKLKDKINDVEITLDYLPFLPYLSRPIGYHEYASNAIIKLKKAGFKVGVQTVLTRDNINKNMIYNLYSWLIENQVDEWSLLRFFPSGRGKIFANLTPSYNEYCDTVEYIKQIFDKDKINVSFQYLLPNHEGYTLSCRAVKKSFGIMPDGTVLGCFWALDEKMKPKKSEFVLGKLPVQTIEEILKSENSNKWIENNHNCIFFDKNSLENNNRIIV